MSEHTKTPWVVSRKFEIGPISTADDQGFGMIDPLCDVYGDNKEANASFIARAVNAHADLVEALKLHVAYESIPQDRGGKTGTKGKAWTAFIEARDAALAKAGG